MKTFKDLEFKPHSVQSHFDTQAELEFDNGYGVSVITRPSAYSNTNCPYEIAVLYKGSICYSTDITDDVIGYQTEADVTEVMRRVQGLAV